VDKNKFNSRDKLPFHREWLEAYRSGAATSPICVELDLTNACNYRCPNCVWGDYIGNNRTTVSCTQALDQVRQIGTAGVKAIIFSGGGEPLLHPAITECMQEARRWNLRVGLFTNGIHLTPNRAEVLATCVDWIRVHLDAVSPEGYTRRHRRGPSDFEKLRENLAYFNALASTTEVGIGAVVNPDTFSELAGLAELASETGCSYLQAKHDFDLLARAEYTEWWARKVVPQLRELADQFRSIGLAIHFTETDYTVAPRSRRCHIHHLTTAINAESNYSYCKRLRDKPEWAAGNLAKEPLQQILSGERNQKLSREVTPQNCGINCPYLGLNDLIDDYCEGRVSLPPAEADPGEHVYFF